MKKSILIIRWIVGILFIFSGLIKANDPLGLSYKMQEFFDAWGMNSFNHLSLGLSIGMNSLEILLGLAMILGFGMRLFSWLILLLTLFFAFLTGYASLSGKFRSCGCFGDCLPLQPFQSFLKDLILLVLVYIIFRQRNKIRPVFKKTKASILLLLSFILISFGVQAYVLNHLPAFDCLAYKKGSHLLEEMKVPAGAVADSFAINFQYEKAGKMVEFDANHFPADFDSTYIYKGRYDKLIKKGNATPLITDFALQSLDGEDDTKSILENPGNYVLVLVRSFSGWQNQKDAFEKVRLATKQAGIPLLVASPEADKGRQLIDSSVAIYRLDAVVVKTAARVNATYFLFKGDQILEKNSYLDQDVFIRHLHDLPKIH